MPRRPKLPETLEELRQHIEDEVPYVDVAPYSHNIITLLLGQVAQHYGHAEANKVIRELGLEALGWRQREELQ